MSANSKFTKKKMPILVKDQRNTRPVIGDVTIEQTAQPACVEIKVVVQGRDAQLLGDFVASSEIIGLSFEAISAFPIYNKE